MRAFLHTRPKGTSDWTNDGQDFARLPIVGEYVCRDDTGTWYRVQLVVHRPQADYDAEVFAVEVDHIDEMSAAFPDMDHIEAGR